MKSSFTLRDLTVTLLLFVTVCFNSKNANAQIDASFYWYGYNGMGPDACKGDQIEFDNWGTGSETTWNWTFPGGNPSSSTDPYAFIVYNNTGSYTVTLIVGDGMGNFDTSTQIIDVYGFDVSETHINSTCADSSGSIDLNVTGYSGFMYYYWYYDNSFNEDIANIPAGIHIVEMYDDYCYLDYYVAVQNSDGPILTETHNNIGCGTPMGSIDATVTGGVPPYGYYWSNGANTQDLSNLIGGQYICTVTDQNNCHGYIIVNITDSTSGFYPYINAVQPNCTNNGSLTATPNGGQPPYTYLWSNGGTTATISGLAAGNYSLTMSDNSGCQNVSVSNYTLTSDCFNIIEGHVFNDVNGNCDLDAGETPVLNCTVIASNGLQQFYGNTNSSGNYSIEINIPGTFNLSASLWGMYSCSVSSICENDSVVFGAVGDTSYSNNIGFQGTSGFDLNLHPGWTSANPGFEKEYWVMPFNSSYTAFTGTATVTFNYDPNLIYDTSYAPLPVVDTINHTLTWTVSNVPTPNFNWGGRFRNFFHVPATLSNGYLLQSDFDITPTSGDCNPQNNHLHFSETVTGSHDPNEKTVTPAGFITTADSVLTYSIHFQNSGTDTTHFVIVKDTLSTKLDAATVENIASSHNYSEFTVSGQGILTWVFNPIFLVDSATNEAASKGFVMFRVKVKPNTPIETSIENTASIYFDYNQPVVTNTVSNSIVNSISEIADGSDISIYPNPASDELTVQLLNNRSAKNITVTDVLGREIFNEQTNLISKSYNLTAMPAGIYFIKVQLQNRGVVVKRFVKE